MERETRPLYVYGIVYKYTNMVNGKVYIGQTTQPMHRRRSEHKTAAQKPYKPDYQSPFQRALRKYSAEKFQETVLFAAFDKDSLDKAEIMYIADLNAIDRRYGYNLTYGGNSHGMHTEATKQKISEASKILWTKPEHRARMAQVVPNISGLHTPEAIAKSTLAKIGKPARPDQLCNLALGRLACAKPVERIDMVTGAVTTYDRVTQVAVDGFWPVAVIKCCKGRKRFHKGFYWRYLSVCK